MAGPGYVVESTAPVSVRQRDAPRRTDGVGVGGKLVAVEAGQEARKAGR